MDTLDGRVRIGVGRDAAEIAFSTPFGAMEPTDMEIRIDWADGDPEPAQWIADVISTEAPAPRAGAV
ncbi:hypothetical protein FHU13_000169 [Methylobacterium sp. R2-1]|nr:hypothetical protein [Methylobacterium sp. R2-1]MBB2959808.1 hypothetical protein [Methylobacterium sp. R2-1]